MMSTRLKTAGSLVVHIPLATKKGNILMSVKDVLKFAADEKAAYVNVRFTDLVGAWHHLTFPIGELSEKSFEEGFGFDGSSFRGWGSIHESVMLLVPDPYRLCIHSFVEG